MISKAVICFQCLLWQYDDITEERLVSESQRLKVFREAVLRTAGSHRCSEKQLGFYYLQLLTLRKIILNVVVKCGDSNTCIFALTFRGTFTYYKFIKLLNSSFLCISLYVVTWSFMYLPCSITFVMEFFAER